MQGGSAASGEWSPKPPASVAHLDQVVQRVGDGKHDVIAEAVVVRLVLVATRADEGTAARFVVVGHAVCGRPLQWYFVAAG